MKEWERKLRQREDRLCEGRQNLGEREVKAIEAEKNLKQKERDLEVFEKNIDSSNSLLKVKEAEISKRVAYVDTEEKVCFLISYRVCFAFCLHVIAFIWPCHSAIIYVVVMVAESGFFKENA